MSNKRVIDPTQIALSVDVEERTFELANGRELQAVGKLEFSLNPHSFTCIVGPSGCGKTTTLRMVLGLDRGYKGIIQQAKTDGVAAVFQEPRLLPWRTVEQNIRLVLPATRQAESLDSLFDALELNEVRAFFPGQLSLGLARRVALARAFVLNPSLLILDEPFVSLDDSTADRLRNLLLTLWSEKNTTALMVTHNLREAAMLADRILVFSKRPSRMLGEVFIGKDRELRNAAYINDIVKEVQRISADV